MFICGTRADFGQTCPSRPGRGTEWPVGRQIVKQEAKNIETVAVIGMGLMGGSVGLACLRSRAAARVVGYDSDPQSTRQALAVGAITEAAFTLPFSVKEADLVIIAVPVGAIPEVFKEIAPYLKPGCIVTDVGSTKAGILEQIAGYKPPSVEFIGGHPVAGSENHGIAGASADLFEGALWIITPGETATQAEDRLVYFLEQLGAKVVKLDALRHDEALALTSHLPQLLSSTLMAFAADAATSGDGLPLLAAGGFRDMTRIAASSPEVWVDIVKENQTALLALLNRFRATLDSLATVLENRDWQALSKQLSQAREVRRALPLKAGMGVADLEELLISVPDRPGVLAEVSTILRESEVNIEDLNIVHMPEGGRGVIHLAVSGARTAELAVDALGKGGFSVERP